MWSPKSAALKTFWCRLRSLVPGAEAGEEPGGGTTPPVEGPADRDEVEAPDEGGGGGAEGGVEEGSSTIAWTEMVYESVVAPTTGAFMEDGIICF